MYKSKRIQALLLAAIMVFLLCCTAFAENMPGVATGNDLPAITEEPPTPTETATAVPTLDAATEGPETTEQPIPAAEDETIPPIEVETTEEPIGTPPAPLPTQAGDFVSVTTSTRVFLGVDDINENGINYTLCGDYYIPDWQIPVTDRTLGYYGRMRKAYLETQRPALYAGYVAHGTLFDPCAEIETQARQRLDVMMAQIVQEWGISEEMKSTDPLGWAGLMNQARHCADEIILNELIYC